MKREPPPTFMDILQLQDAIRRRYYETARLNEPTEVLAALTSGLDAMATIMEGSSAEFDGLSTESANRVSSYLHAESKSYAASSVEISIWYSSWAEAIECLFLDADR